jgi:hypothetical protein
MMESMELISLTLFGPTVVAPPPPISAAVGTSAVAPASHHGCAPSPPLAVSRPAPLAAPESSRAATRRGKKQNILVKGLKTLISM